MGENWENIDWGQEPIQALNLNPPSLNSSSTSNSLNDNAGKPRQDAARRGSWFEQSFNSEQEKEEKCDTSFRKPARGFGRRMSLGSSLVPLQDESVGMGRKKMSRRCSTGLDVDWPEATDDLRRRASHDDSKKDEQETRFPRRLSFAPLESESNPSFPNHSTSDDPETKLQGGQLRRSSFLRSSMAVLEAVAKIAQTFENDLSDSDDDLEVPFPSSPRRALSQE
ncbi:hypothetical protein ACHAXS_003792 [Conticribra weissflogii]